MADTKYYLEVAKDHLNAYFANDSVVRDFGDVPSAIRLAYVQKTPEAFIKERPVGKNKKGDVITVPYIDHFYAEKALNFISNFMWGSEKISSEIEKVKTAKGQTKWVASVEMKCWLELEDDKGNVRRIERYIASGHDMYENPAITKADALQSAISKAHTKFARQFGIGTNIQNKEEKAYTRVSRHYLDGELSEADVKDAVVSKDSDRTKPEAQEKVKSKKEGKESTKKVKKETGVTQHDTEAVEENLSEGEAMKLDVFKSYELLLDGSDTEYKLKQAIKKFYRGFESGLITNTQHDELVRKAKDKIKSLEK